MITAIIECNNCGRRIEKKYPWIRDFKANDLANLYEAEGFSDDYLGIDVCPECKEKFEDVSFRE